MIGNRGSNAIMTINHPPSPLTMLGPGDVGVKWVVGHQPPPPPAWLSPVTCTHVYYQHFHFRFPSLLCHLFCNRSLVYRYCTFSSVTLRHVCINITIYSHVYQTCLMCKLSIRSTRVPTAHVSLLADTRALTDNSTTAAGADNISAVVVTWLHTPACSWCCDGPGVPSPLGMTPWQYDSN